MDLFCARRARSCRIGLSAENAAGGTNVRTQLVACTHRSEIWMILTSLNAALTPCHHDGFAQKLRRRRRFNRSRQIHKSDNAKCQWNDVHYESPWTGKAKLRLERIGAGTARRIVTHPHAPPFQGPDSRVGGHSWLPPSHISLTVPPSRKERKSKQRRGRCTYLILRTKRVTSNPFPGAFRDAERIGVKGSLEVLQPNWHSRHGAAMVATLRPCCETFHG